MKMTDIMKKSHSESKSENLDAILQKIDNKAFITNSADSAHTETKPQPIKLRRKSVGIAAVAVCAAVAVGAFAFSGLLKPDIDTTLSHPPQLPQIPQHSRPRPHSLSQFRTSSIRPMPKPKSLSHRQAARP